MKGITFRICKITVSRFRIYASGFSVVPLTQSTRIFCPSSIYSTKSIT